MGFFNLGEKYRALILSIAGLLLLIFLFLMFTIFATIQTQRNNQVIDGVHEVAINTQSTLKDLFDLERSSNEDITSPHMKTVISRIRETIDETDQVFKGLETGAAITYEGREGVELPQVTGEVRERLLKVKAEWDDLTPALNTYLREVNDITIDSSKSLYLASSKAAVSSVVMEESMQELLGGLHEDIERTNTIVTAVQVVGIFVLLAYFAVFLLVFLRRLQVIDSELDASRQETKEIMATVNTGLFLLNKDLTIGSQYSQVLEDIIGTKNLSGERLSSILRNRISEKDLRTAEDFVEQLYNPRVKEKLVNTLNPLNKVLLHDDTQTGNTRYLDFKFSRVYEGKEIARILVNVNDVSEAVKLEQRLEKERAENDLQIEMLTTILSVSPKLIGEFISNVYTHIDRMNAVLKNPGSSQFELENKLKSIYREMHSLKGEASALKLHSFTKIASEAEDKLHALQNQGKLSGNDFLSLAVHLDELLSLSKVIAGLGQRINEATSQLSGGLAEYAHLGNVAGSGGLTSHAAESITNQVVARPDAKAELGDYLVQFGLDIATRQGKAVDIDVSEMAGNTIPEELSVVVREIAVQLMRNALVHGIADSETRVKRGKSFRGRISVSLKENHQDGSVMLAVEDDGQGIDYDKIRETLVQSGHYDQMQALGLSEPQLLNALFSSGFSTRGFSDEDGGRGVGLDLVKERVKEFGGKVSVQSERGKFTRFIIKLPMP